MHVWLFHVKDGRNVVRYAKFASALFWIALKLFESSVDINKLQQNDADDCQRGIDAEYRSECLEINRLSDFEHRIINEQHAKSNKSIRITARFRQT